jgi:virginiamycin B lyase
MRNSATIPILWLLGLILLVPPTACVEPPRGEEDGSGTPAVAIDEWPVPWEDSRPRDPHVAPDGDVWFVGQRGDYLARLDPETGDFTKHDLDPGTGPHNLIVDGDGKVWYAGNRAAHVGRLDPGTGKIEKFPMPDPESGGRDPHTLIFDGRGHVWFTAQGGNSVGRLAMESGEVSLLDVPTARARPYGIVTTPAGRPWLVEFGSNKLATVDPESMELREVALPREDARPRRLALTSDGAVWYVDYAQGFLGRLDPESGDVREWPAPGGRESRPYGMAADDRDRLWFVETGPEPNRLVGFDPESEEFFAVAEIPSGGGTVRHMVFHEPTRTIWFGTDTNTIGRAKVP